MMLNIMTFQNLCAEGGLHLLYFIIKCLKSEHLDIMIVVSCYLVLVLVLAS